MLFASSRTRKYWGPGGGEGREGGRRPVVIRIRHAPPATQARREKIFRDIEDRGAQTRHCHGRLTTPTGGAPRGFGRAAQTDGDEGGFMSSRLVRAHFALAGALLLAVSSAASIAASPTVPRGISTPYRQPGNVVAA